MYYNICNLGDQDVTDADTKIGFTDMFVVVLVILCILILVLIVVIVSASRRFLVCLSTILK